MTTARLASVVGFGGCLFVGGTALFWIAPLFGAARKRPGLRSTGLGFTLALDLAAFVLLVPHFGVIGACWTAVLPNVVMTVVMVMAASRVMGLPMRDFLLPCRADVRRLWREGVRLLKHGRPPCSSNGRPSAVGSP